MYNEAKNTNVFDLYEVGGLRAREVSNPFVHGVELAGPKGEVVRFRSVFDDGALVNAIDETLYRTLKGRLTALTPSGKVLRMADGRHVPSVGVWKGRVTVKGVNRDGIFEIFKSNGAWAMLFGKPLLKTFNAIHDYTEDTIRILREDKTVGNPIKPIRKRTGRHSQTPCQPHSRHQTTHPGSTKGGR
jgi:hypothetical protein